MYLRSRLAAAGVPGLPSRVLGSGIRGVEGPSSLLWSTDGMSLSARRAVFTVIITGQDIRTSKAENIRTHQWPRVLNGVMLTYRQSHIDSPNTGPVFQSYYRNMSSMMLFTYVHSTSRRWSMARRTNPTSRSAPYEICVMYAVLMMRVVEAGRDVSTPYPSDFVIRGYP